MSQPFIPLPVTDEDVVCDRFGNPLNVGTHVLYSGATMLQGVICGYNHHYFEVAVAKTDSNGNKTAASNHLSAYHSLINAEPLMGAQSIADLNDVYRPVLDFSPSDTKKAARKYAVYLVADQNASHNTTPFASMHVIVTTIAGSTSDDLELLERHLRMQYGYRVVSRLCSSRKRFSPMRTYGQTVITGVDHNWDVYMQSYLQSAYAPLVTTHYIPQSQYQLSKRNLQDIGLLQHLDTIFTVEEYNNLDIEQTSKLEILI